MSVGYWRRTGRRYSLWHWTPFQANDSLCGLPKARFKHGSFETPRPERCCWKCWAAKRKAGQP